MEATPIERTSELGPQRLRESVRALESRLGLLNEAKMECCGVSLAQCAAIVEVGRAESLALGELADRMGLDASTVSRTTQTLVERGLVKRETDGTDRRRSRIGLSQEGAGLYKFIETTMNRKFERVFAFIPPEKRGQVVESLQLLLDALEADG